MYLEHFKLKELPFSITPNVNFFCMLKSYEDAVNLLLFSLKSGEGFIKITGEVGSGKTLLCRKLLDSLSNDFITAYIPNPDLQPNDLRKAFARELNIEVSSIQDQHELLTLINNQLLTFHAQGKSVVLLLDEAQALPLESLESLRLLTNLETETHKLLQVVLFAQPELDEHLQKPSLRQLKQRITFSYSLSLLSREDLDIYLMHRLTKAGFSLGNLFSKKAKDALYASSGGVPRLINIICHKALLLAFGKGEYQVNYKTMLLAIHDMEGKVLVGRRHIVSIISIILILTGLILFYYNSKGII